MQFDPESPDYGQDDIERVIEPLLKEEHEEDSTLDIRGNLRAKSESLVTSRVGSAITGQPSSILILFKTRSHDRLTSMT
jgi:hypothetical protein